MSSHNTSTEAPDQYEMRISRLTVDKLGVKLYDRASAVVAELIANAYDADAENVTVTIPLAKQLARKLPDKTYEDLGLTISVKDDGHGMTPREAQKYFLIVGTDRRKRTDSSGSPAKDAAKSRNKKRPVMGRKGIGKLAPFGICRRIEVISSGGDETTEGYLTSHFTLDFDKIVTDDDSPVPIDPGPLDKTYQTRRGTLVRLSLFLPKRVPNRETFQRQLERRFALTRDDFSIKVYDSESDMELAIRHFQIPLDTTTRISVDDRPVRIGNNDHPVTGWLAHAKEAFKDEESAGVRIYARGKIVATTRDFEQPAGFTGEFATRSYLVGAIHAEWLDDDNDEDLVRTDRQSILWDSEKGDALRQWGKALIKEVAGLAAGPRRESKAAHFLRASKLQQHAEERYGDADIVDAVMDLGKKIGGFAAEDELGDPSYVSDLAEVVLAVAPHQALIGAFKTISGQDDATVDDLLKVFGKARMAEMASYAQIAFERVKSIQELKRLLQQPTTSEADLHQLIAEAPWLIKPDWSVITVNQSLKMSRDLVADWLRHRGHGDFEIAIANEHKRPDFTLINAGDSLHLVELKKPGHSFGKSDYERLENYVVALEDLFTRHDELNTAFPNGWTIDLITDSVGIGDVTIQRAFTKMQEDGQVSPQIWNDFLLHAITTHEQFLDAHDQVRSTSGPTSIRNSSL